MTIMGKSSSRDVLNGIGTPRWGTKVKLSTATFNCTAAIRYNSHTLYAIVDGHNFRFTTENWIYPNQERYRRNQRKGTLWIIYDYMNSGFSLPDKYRKLLEDFVNELNDYFTGNHEELFIEFVLGYGPIPSFPTFAEGDSIPRYVSVIQYQTTGFKVSVPHTPSSTHTPLTKETHAPRSL